MILYNAEKRIITIHTAHTTYQMMADEHDVLLHLYYGRRTEGEMDYLLCRYDRGFSGNPYDAADDRTYSLDLLPQEYPCLGTGDYRKTALSVTRPDGAYSCDLRYVNHFSVNGTCDIPGLPCVHDSDEESETLRIMLRDRKGSGLSVDLFYGVLPELDIITRSVIVRNEGKETICLNRVLSASLDFLSGSFDLITFWGRHGMERIPQREALTHGIKMIGSDRGMSSHHYNPLIILADHTATETQGTCYAMQLAYSGGFLATAEMDAFGQIRLGTGLMEEKFRWPLAPGKSFASPQVIMACSTEGLSRLSQQLHSCIRLHITHGIWQLAARPLLLNSWEGCYFDFDGDRIVEMAKSAKDLGFDLLVMDDGWFGKRDSDTSGLGDWYANEKKLGCSLKELSARVRAEGVKFGIWAEPEMISEDSDLYRAHPDYALALPGGKPVMARNQLVLDLSRREVVDCVFNQLCGVLDGTGISYLKWDYNRSIADVYSATATAENQGRILHRYMLGLYSLLQQLLTRYPALLIEGCSGGGGRFDAGMLFYTPQIWCSDNTDAIDRIRIQYGTSFGYPASSVGAHVSVCPNHQTGRITPLRTRGIVAMSGTFGYELDPAQLSEEEKKEVREQLRTFRKFAPILMDGLYYRLSDPASDPYAAWMQVGRDRSEAILSIVSLETGFNAPQRYVRLMGLEADKLYRIEDAFENGAGILSGDARRFIDADTRFAGSALMEAGLPVPIEKGEYNAYMWHIIRDQS